MSQYIGQCYVCGREFGTEPRFKLAMLHEQDKHPSSFSTYHGFARYYCEECAQEVMKAVRRYEMGGAL